MSNDFIARFCPFDKVDTNWTCSICFDFVEKNEISFDIIVETGNNVVKNGNNVEAAFDIVEKIIRLVAFDNVAGVDGALSVRQTQ